ncbi:MAG: DJ-1/PfpI family protein [bacterium]
MRKLIFAFWYVAVIPGSQISNLDAPKIFAQAAAKIFYVCPMFCNQKTYEKAGACTVCSMQLVAKKAEDNQTSSGAKKLTGYVCPPCGSDCDNATHEKPGACAVCGMALVTKSAAQAMSTANRPSAEHVLARNKRVAIFIFDGVQIIDYAAPYEVFGQAGFEVFTVAEKMAAITTAMGMSVNPKYTFDNHPPANILMLPGGDVTQHQGNPKVIKWIQDQAKQAEVVLSVCNGAFFLAKAGLLDGLEATTFASLLDGLQAAAPKAKVVSDKRFVDNGKIVTSAGLSSGIDGALHVVEKVLGRGWTEVIATNLEYDWNPKGEYVRAALADKYLRNTYNFMRSFEREVVSSTGDVEHWENKWKIKTDASAAEILAQLNDNLAAVDQWKRGEAAQANDTAKSLWQFTGNDGKTWKGMASVETLTGEKNAYRVSLKVARNEVAAK